MACDIPGRAFPDKRVLLLDRLDFSFMPNRHERVRIDGFAYQPYSEDHANTLLFSHVQQFIDDDLAELCGGPRKLDTNVVIA